MSAPEPILKFKSAEDCPAIETHTAAPTGYTDWHNWAARMAKTHTQHRCPTCGFYVIWTRKAVR